MKICAIRDKKAESYVPELMLFENLVQASRAFEAVVNNPKTQINRYPDDFCLVCLGEYNHVTGLFDLKSMPDILCEARSLYLDIDKNRASSEA